MQCIALHYITLRWTALQYTTLPSIPLQYITLRSITVQWVHNTMVQCIALRYSALHYSLVHCIRVQCIAFNYVHMIWVICLYICMSSFRSQSLAKAGDLFSISLHATNDENTMRQTRDVQAERNADRQNGQMNYHVWKV